MNTEPCTASGDVSKGIPKDMHAYGPSVLWMVTQVLVPPETTPTVCVCKHKFKFALKCSSICDYVRGLHTFVCLSYVCKPFVVACIALLLHMHMFFMDWLMELSSSCLCDVVYCCLMCSGILHRRAPRADLIT